MSAEMGRFETGGWYAPFPPNVSRQSAHAPHINAEQTITPRQEIFKQPQPNTT
jgi:hypothetical protein